MALYVYVGANAKKRETVFIFPLSSCFANAPVCLSTFFHKDIFPYETKKPINFIHYSLQECCFDSKKSDCSYFAIAQLVSASHKECRNLFLTNN